MRGIALGEVVESRHAGFSQGDVVNTGFSTWAEYNTKHGDEMFGQLPQLPGVPLETYLHPLGMTGLTAYFGVTEVCKVQAGQTLVVTGAAGAVGSIAAQIGKILGCRVVGVAGGTEKCRWLIEEAGLDGAIDYKNDDIAEALARLCPDGVDCVFENVGGPVLDELVLHMNYGGRIALCGVVAGYDSAESIRGPAHFAQIFERSVSIIGFGCIDYAEKFPAAAEQMIGWFQQGKFKYHAQLVDGFENIPQTLIDLLAGKYMGKVSVSVA